MKVDHNYPVNGASHAHLGSAILLPFEPTTAEPASPQPRSERESTVSLIIPTRNEARNVADVLERVPEMVSEVLIVDTRSSDVTRLMARSTLPDIRIIEEPKRGKGNALRA